MIEPVPFAISAETLASLRPVAPGDTVYCVACGGGHALEAVAGGQTDLLFYRCGADAYLGAVAGRDVCGRPVRFNG